MDKVEKYLSDIARKMGTSVDVWFADGATYPDGTSVEDVALWNEFGVPSRNQPARPFFRRMVEKEQETWPAKIAALAEMTNYDGDKIMEIMGQDIKGALQQSIVDLVSPPLAPSTIRKKGFDKPLIDTSHMLNSVMYEVKK